MPPKKLRNDWSWADQVKTASDITDQHRLAAAGLTDVLPCTYAFPIFDGDEIPVKGKKCNKRYCETNPACHNHLGVADLLDSGGKGKYVESKLSKRAEKRKEGIPAGLRNLGATCYVRSAFFDTLCNQQSRFGADIRQTHSSSCGSTISRSEMRSTRALLSRTPPYST